MKNRDELSYSRICNGKLYSYSVCEDGTVIKTTLKTLKESRVKPFIHKGKACVKIAGKDYILKRLVAEHFKGRKPNESIVLIDKNPLNCHKDNLEIVSKTELGKRTGHMSGKAKPVIT